MRIGGFARSGRGILLDDAVTAPADWGRRRLVAREIFVTTLLESLGCPADGTRLELHATAEAQQRVYVDNLDLTGSSQHDWLELPEARTFYIDDDDEDNDDDEAPLPSSFSAHPTSITRSDK